MLRTLSWAVIVGLIYAAIITTVNGQSSEAVPAKSLRGLTVFTDKVMTACNASLKPGRRSMLTNQIAKVAYETYDVQEHAEAFIGLICIESKFQSLAKSGAGAQGITQVMPKYAQEFGASCGYDDITGADLADTEISLRIGACHFKQLLLYHKSVPLALAAYNSGKDSSTVKRLSNLQEGLPETSGYLAKYAMLREKLK